MAQSYPRRSLFDKLESTLSENVLNKVKAFLVDWFWEEYFIKIFLYVYIPMLNFDPPLSCVALPYPRSHNLNKIEFT